ncbi:MAG TPA: hypothetical protein VLA88_00530 [Candidatus Saccharimonadales bacterium]|nr:hypothetical protein [Candidatus Saccharimonadales bacterium]
MAATPTIVDFVFYQKIAGHEELVWLLYYQDSPQWAGWQVPNRRLTLPEQEAQNTAVELAEDFGGKVVLGSLKKVVDTKIASKDGQQETPFTVYEAEVTRETQSPQLVDKRLYAPFAPEDALYTDLMLTVRDRIAERYNLQHLKEAKV